jgi:hypothetical protein
VQALAGVLLPSATVFLLLLCNDKAVLGPWVNKTWLNVVGSIIVGILVVLSFILAITTMFPDVDVELLSIGLTIALVLGLAITGLMTMMNRQKNVANVEVDEPMDPETWRMSPLEVLPKPVWSTGKKIAMLTLRGYLVITVVVLVIKVVSLAMGNS